LCASHTLTAPARVQETVCGTRRLSLGCYRMSQDSLADEYSEPIGNAGSNERYAARTPGTPHRIITTRSSGHSRVSLELNDLSGLQRFKAIHRRPDGQRAQALGPARNQRAPCGTDRGVSAASRRANGLG